MKIELDGPEIFAEVDRVVEQNSVAERITVTLPSYGFACPVNVLPADYEKLFAIQLHKSIGHTVKAFLDGVAAMVETQFLRESLGIKDVEPCEKTPSNGKIEEIENDK